MPYIKEKTRTELKTRSPRNAGELNYTITELVIDYIESKGLSYQNINDCVGALVGAKDEFTRRVVHAYEDIKINENGDVYPGWMLKGKKK